MVKSMYAAVAGLKTHQSKLDVIGNNIANVNTYGYKKERATFADTYYSTSRTASEATNVKGGVNPSQVGYGVKMEGIDTIVTTGGASITDNPTDVMISGNGYFLVGSYNAAGYTNTSAESGAGDELGLTSLKLTRVGAFSFDGQGNFVDTGSNYVQGYASARGTQYYYSGSSTDTTTGITTYTYAYPLTDESGTVTAGAATATVTELRSLDGTLTGYSVSYYEVDDAGAQTGEQKTFTLSKGDYTAKADTLYVLPATGTFSDTKSYTIDENTGYVKNIATGVVETVSDKLTAIQIPRTYTLNGYVDADGNPLTVTLYNENDSVTVNAYRQDSTTGTIALDTDNPQITVTGEEYWAVSTPMELSSISVGSDGTVTGVNADSTVISLGKIAVANVPNPGALENQGDSYYIAKANTGVIEAFNPGEGSTGSLASGSLEMSNVDLSTEFTEMITTQRGYQANARIITVTDSMLEELVNLKRS